MREDGAAAGCAVTHITSVTEGRCVLCGAEDADENGTAYLAGEWSLLPGNDIIAFTCDHHGDEYDDVVRAPIDHPDERPVGIEARCHTCGETFNPAGMSDLMHVDTATGDDCGPGQLIGAWH